ncbi:MAG: hypothetical protein GKC08_02955 [Methanosarcinales archaeon]|uniref:hypothetical protein n=1 Tax=Methanococcoides methylutens TaxID=2226 RepID=UPI00181A10C2|nr:hypothetical protein [Methanosarcinales archaeon]
MMRNITRISDKCGRREDGTYHSVVSGQTTEKLDAEELELYKFILGGMLAK